MRLNIPQRSNRLARVALIGMACFVAWVWMVAPPVAPQSADWPDLSDPVGQLQCAIGVLVLILSSVIGTLRRVRRQLPPPPIEYAPIKNAKRFAILKRDGYRCQICGRSAQHNIVLEVDHKLARAKGGNDDPTNLWTLCSICNNGKSDSAL